jgi:Glycosyl hydrolases family 43.
LCRNILILFNYEKISESILCVALCVLFSSVAYASNNPLPVKFGDPYVLLASDGRYYMYGTGAGAVDGFCAYSSPDLVNWKAEGQVFRGNIPGSWGVANFWAPEVYELNGKFYMLYSADWKVNPPTNKRTSGSG